MIGPGIDMYYNQTVVDVLVGLGVGFLLFGFVKTLMK
jgi:hypothetical protein